MDKRPRRVAFKDYTMRKHALIWMIVHPFFTKRRSSIVQSPADSVDSPPLPPPLPIEESPKVEVDKKEEGQEEGRRSSARIHARKRSQESMPVPSPDSSTNATLPAKSLASSAVVMHPFFTAVAASKKQKLSNQKSTTHNKNDNTTTTTTTHDVVDPLIARELALLERQQRLLENRKVSTKVAAAITRGSSASDDSVAQDGEPLVHAFFQQRASSLASTESSSLKQHGIRSKKSEASLEDLVDPPFPGLECVHVGMDSSGTEVAPFRTFSFRTELEPWIHVDNGFPGIRSLVQLEEPGRFTNTATLPPSIFKFEPLSVEEKRREFLRHFSEAVLDTPVIQRALSLTTTTVDDPSLPFVDKYRPNSSLELLLHPEDEPTLAQIRTWLQSMSKRVPSVQDIEHSRPSSSLSSSSSSIAADSDNDSDFYTPRKYKRRIPRVKESSPPSYASAILLHSERPTLKTALVYALAKEFGFHVMEVNNGVCRSGAELLELIGECALSHRVTTHATSARQSLILVESVDIVFPQHDVQFWKILMNIVATSRSPIILTCNHLELIPEKWLDTIPRFSLHNPSEEQRIAYLLAVCLNEGYQLHTLLPLRNLLPYSPSLRQNLMQLELVLRCTSENFDGLETNASLKERDLETVELSCETYSFLDSFVYRGDCGRMEPWLEKSRSKEQVQDYRDEYRTNVVDVHEHCGFAGNLEIHWMERLVDYAHTLISVEAPSSYPPTPLNECIGKILPVSLSRWSPLVPMYYVPAVQIILQSLDSQRANRQRLLEASTENGLDGIKETEVFGVGMRRSSRLRVTRRRSALQQEPIPYFVDISEPMERHFLEALPRTYSSVEM